MTDLLVARLRAAGCVFAEDEADEIRRVLSDPDAIDRAVTARERGHPLEQILGVARFAGVEVALGAGVFVPRVRAAVLVEVAAAGPEPRIAVDLGCGSGAIAAALRVRFPAAQVHACDLDPAALEFARANGARHGFAVHAGDWWSALPRALHGRIDLAVAYLPHVPTARLAGIAGDYRQHEPGVAVDGGPDGLDPLRAVLSGLDWLAPTGRLITLVSAEQLAAARGAVGVRSLTLHPSDDDAVLTIAS
jgi:release factor glutamine methyltransferase